MFKKAISVILIVFIILSMMVVPTFAQVTAPNGVIYDNCVFYDGWYAGKSEYIPMRTYFNGGLEETDVHYVVYGSKRTYHKYAIDGVGGSSTLYILKENFHSLVSTDAEMILIDAKSVLQGTLNFFGNAIAQVIDGIGNWIGSKVEKIQMALDIGNELLDKAGAYIVWKVSSLFDIPPESDIQNGVTSNYSDVMQGDVFINLIEGSTNNYNITIHNHATGEVIYNDVVTAVLNSSTNTYVLDFEMISDKLPSYRGKYNYEVNSVIWDLEDNTYKPNNQPASHKGVIGSGSYVIGKESEILDALDGKEDNEPEEPNVPIENDEITWLQKIYNKLAEIFDYLVNGNEDENMDPSKPKNVLGWLDHLTGLVSNIKDFFTTDLPNLGSALSGIGNSVGDAVGDAINKFEIPTGFVLGLPKFIILIGGVLIALIGVVTRFIVFITTLWNVEPTSELLSPEMIEGLEYVRGIPIPVFGNLEILTVSLITLIAGFLLINIIRRNEGTNG